MNGKLIAPPSLLCLPFIDFFSPHVENDAFPFCEFFLSNANCLSQKQKAKQKAIVSCEGFKHWVVSARTSPTLVISQSQVIFPYAQKG